MVTERLRTSVGLFHHAPCLHGSPTVRPSCTKFVNPGCWHFDNGAIRKFDDVLLEPSPPFFFFPYTWKKTFKNKNTQKFETKFWFHNTEYWSKIYHVWIGNKTFMLKNSKLIISSWVEFKNDKILCRGVTPPLLLSKNEINYEISQNVTLLHFSHSWVFIISSPAVSTHRS